MPAGVIASAELAELAGAHAVRELHWRIADLGRLAALASGTSAGESADQLTVKVRFLPATDGLARLDLDVRGELQVTCQRCLLPMAWPVTISAELCIVASDDDAATLREPMDAVTLGHAGLDLAELTEDEVLAALPLAPMHAAGSGCGAGNTAAEADDGVSRPFVGLAALLREDPDDAGKGR